jgi:hypothetical protein
MKNNFKIRCSAIGDIMTNAKKEGELSKTAITYLETWAKEQIYGRRKEIKGKQLDKGIVQEFEAIELLSCAFPEWPLLIKNEQRFEDEFMTGTPDLILPDEIIDIKCPWDCFSYPLFEQDCPEKNYYWQLQGYMNLTGKRKAKLIYCLMDTPEELVEKEVRFNPEDEAKIRAYHSYKGIPDKYRIKIFDVYRSDEDIERIKERVKECRLYISEL